MTILVIHWGVGPEFVTLADDIAVGQTIETTERWIYKTGSPSVQLKAYIEKAVRQGHRHILRLRYDKARQSGRAKAARIGTSDISWDGKKCKGRATWRDQSGLSFDGTVNVTALTVGRPSHHLKKTVSVIVRPQQSKLKDDLILRDYCCALTGETERQVLDAAHIVPAAANGKENLANAVLLRADLHRLFDAGLSSFAGPKASVVPSPKLSPYYAKMLKGKTLPGEMFARVKQALSERAMLPDNRSRR